MFSLSSSKKYKLRMKLVAFNGFRSDIDKISTRNEIAQWSRRFFLLPDVDCSRVSSKRALWRELRPLSTSFSFFLHVDSFMFTFCLALKVPHTQRPGGKKPAKNFCAMNGTQLSPAGQEGSAKREMGFLSFVFFSEIEQRNFIRKGRRKHTNAVCKVS